MRLLPNEQIAYFADNEHVPYGERPLDEIRGFALEITRFLIGKGAKAVVMACNMSSAVALDAAREHFVDTPVLGMIEPGAKAALAVAGNSPIGVLATSGTVKSGAYERLIQKIDPNRRVVQQGCPKFVPLVETGKAEGEEAEVAAREYVAPLLRERCETIILGCTHYPFLRSAIQRAAGSGITIVDPAEQLASALGNTLMERGLADSGIGGPHLFYTSRETTDFATIGSAFLGKSIQAVEKATWGVDLGQSIATRVLGT
jgi:glutamate racemase